MSIQGKIKFVHPKGYGFVTTEQGDVFFHLSRFRRPCMEYSQGQPTVTFAEESIEPDNAMVGQKVDLDVIEGEKGLAATMWWYSDDLEFADAERIAVPYYRLISRQIIVSKPFAVPEEKCWKVRHSLTEAVEFEGYLPALKRCIKWPGRQFQLEQRVGNEWEQCECPLGRYNGGNLFERSLDWSEVV